LATPEPLHWQHKCRFVFVFVISLGVCWYGFHSVLQLDKMVFLSASQCLKPLNVTDELWCLLALAFACPVHGCSTSCCHCLQVTTTLTDLDISDQDPPISAEVQTALLAALQVNVGLTKYRGPVEDDPSLGRRFEEGRAASLLGKRTREDQDEDEENEDEEDQDEDEEEED